MKRPSSLAEVASWSRSADDFTLNLKDFCTIFRRTRPWIASRRTALPGARLRPWKRRRRLPRRNRGVLVPTIAPALAALDEGLIAIL
jgi:hypothetical protein